MSMRNLPQKPGRQTVFQKASATQSTRWVELMTVRRLCDFAQICSKLNFTIAVAAGLWYNMRRQRQKSNMNTNLLLNGLLLLALTRRGARLLV